MHPENPFKCMLIDTKDIFESNIMAFHGIKYKPNGNKLSHHLELVFDQPKDADIPVGGFTGQCGEPQCRQSHQR